MKKEILKNVVMAILVSEDKMWLRNEVDALISEVVDKFSILEGITDEEIEEVAKDIYTKCPVIY